jgi:hypothetical protein
LAELKKAPVAKPGLFCFIVASELINNLQTDRAAPFHASSVSIPAARLSQNA